MPVRPMTLEEYLHHPHNVDVLKAVEEGWMEGFYHAFAYGIREGRPLTTTEPLPFPPEPPVVPPIVIPPVPPTEPYYMVDNGEVRVTIARHFGGAISSLLLLMGPEELREFVEKTDPGRLIQTAVQLNLEGEKNNPTQGGTISDDDTGTSATVLQAASVVGNVITTQAQLAYWLPRDGVTLSNVILTEQITVGIPMSKRIIKIVPNLFIPDNYGSGLFEILTGYLLDRFSTFQTFDPVTAALSAPLIDGPRNENVPLIVSSDPQHAMGVYTPNFTGIDGKGSGYCWLPASYLGSPTNKWSLWFMRANTPAGNYKGECYIIVGTVNEVQNLMIELHWQGYGPPPVPIPVPPPIPPPVPPGPYTPPADWEDAAYLFLFTDVAQSSKYRNNPLAHWFEWGEKEKRIWKPEGWSSAQYLKNNSDVALAGLKPLLHYWQFGKAEGRSYYKPGVEIGIWPPPTTPGLHVILSQPNSKKEIFSTCRIPKGLVIGEYGLYEGGPSIKRWDGTLTNELNIPDIESVMDILDPGDGLPVACTEHYGRIYKRTAAGTWEKKYDSGRQTALCLGLALTSNTLVGAITINDGSKKSIVIHSEDKGQTWTAAPWSGIELFGVGSDGTNINLCGMKSGQSVMTNINGSVLCSVGVAGRGFWGICGKDGLWNLGTWSAYEDGVNDSARIFSYNGAQLQQVYSTDRPHIHAMGIAYGRRWAVATWDWNSSGKTSLLLVSPDGKSWSVAVEIPCPHVIGMSFGDGGLFLSGGKFREYGRVYFYKF